jgi:hypothetical protein
VELGWLSRVASHLTRSQAFGILYQPVFLSGRPPERRYNLEQGSSLGREDFSCEHSVDNTPNSWRNECSFPKSMLTAIPENLCTPEEGLSVGIDCFYGSFVVLCASFVVMLELSVSLYFFNPFLAQYLV